MINVWWSSATVDSTWQSATYSCIKTAFHDTDVLADIGEDVGVVECGLYAIVCVGETSVGLLL